MKTLKLIVLLTVMLVNVTPYIKDGKLEWKANEAAAQNYVCESNFFTFTWLTGDHKCVNTQNQADWFWGATHDCIKQNTQCICSECHHLFSCNVSATKCSDCLEDQPDEDPPADNGDNPDDGSSDPNPGTDPGTGSNPGGDTGSSGSGGTGDSGSGSSGTGTETQACILKESFHVGITTGTYTGDNHINWCVFNTLAFLKGQTACYWAQQYGRTCEPTDTAGLLQIDAYSFFKYKGGLNFEYGAETRCDMFQKVQNGNKGLLCFTNSIVSGANHVYVHYWFHKETGDSMDDIIVFTYDTDNGTMNPIKVNYGKMVDLGFLNYIIY